MAICLHALLALVLTDFRLTTFFKTSHGFGFSRFGCQRIAGEWQESWYLEFETWYLKIVLQNDLTKRVFDDALGSKFFKVGDKVSCDGILDDRFDGYPVVLGEAGNGRAAEGR